MSWLTWLLLAARVFLIARQHGPEIAGLYRDVMEMINDLRGKGAMPASTEYFHGQAQAELSRLRGIKSRNPAYMKNLHEQVSAARDRANK